MDYLYHMSVIRIIPKAGHVEILSKHVLGLSLLISLGSYAQKNKRTSAYMYNKNKQFDKAIEAIDEAVKHPKTEKDAKTWMYRGIIYYNVANDTAPEVNELAPNAADISVESFAKAKEYDEKDALEGEITMCQYIC